jgi:hypothetical protein
MQSATDQDELRTRTVPFTADDGVALNLVNVRGKRDPWRGPVLLVHGAGVRATLFCAPVPRNIVEALVEHGYDVWLENWRASIEFAAQPWTLDQAAAFDHPAAVRKVVEETGSAKVKAIIHCQGSTSFAMSAVAGLVPQVDTIVSNAVSLHTVVPRWSRFKLNYVVPVASWIMPYLNPRWGISRGAPKLPAKAITALVKLFHRECDNGVCKMVSFTYGSGRPALWLHENLNEETHEWIKDEFGEAPLSFFRQMARCVRHGHLVSQELLKLLPADYTLQPPQTDARFALFAGEKSRCFLPEGQSRTHEYLSSFRSDYHTLHLLPDYSHLDVFIGKNADRDVFPLIIAELDREPTPRVSITTVPAVPVAAPQMP